MKTIFKILFITVLSLSLSNCDNDDGNADNQNACNYQGMSYLDTNDNTQILIPESDLTTDIFLTSSNGPEWEIFGTTASGDFLTLVYSPGSNPPVFEFVFNGTNFPVTISEIRNDNVVGGELRADVSHSGFEIEYCVFIDQVN